MTHYAMVSFSPGVVTNIAPRDTEAETALAAGRQGKLVDAINELARAGYRIAPGSSFAGQSVSSGHLFMERATA